MSLAVTGVSGIGGCQAGVKRGAREGELCEGGVPILKAGVGREKRAHTVVLSSGMDSWPPSLWVLRKGRSKVQATVGAHLGVVNPVQSMEPNPWGGVSRLVIYFFYWTFVLIY